MMTILALGAPRSCHPVSQDTQAPLRQQPDFDNLIWMQYRCPQGMEQTAYEWHWAYIARLLLGVENRDSLDKLCDEYNQTYQLYSDSPSTSDMTLAADFYAGTARFRMLNAYHALQEALLGTPLGGDTCFLYQDYVLWEELFKEFDEHYDERGNGRGVGLSLYHRNLSIIRTDVLFREMDSILQGEVPAGVKTPQWDRQWIQKHPAIRRWYDYRLTMAEKLQQAAPSQAQCIISLSRQAVQWYMDFTTDFETNTQVSED